MTRPSNSEKCKKCRKSFVPVVEVEALPFFNSVDKTRWIATNCPHCSFQYKVARLSKRSFDVCLVPTEKLRKEESRESESLLDKKSPQEDKSSC